MSVTFRYFLPDDLDALTPQAEQAEWMTAAQGGPVPMTPEELFSAGPAWTALDGAAVLCCAGFGEIAPSHATLWAIFAGDLGMRMLAITRYARQQIDDSRYARIDAMVRAGHAAGIRWALGLGLAQVHTLRCWGASCEDYHLFERIRA